MLVSSSGFDLSHRHCDLQTLPRLACNSLQINVYYTLRDFFWIKQYVPQLANNICDFCRISESCLTWLLNIFQIGMLDGFGWQDSARIMMQRLIWRTQRGLLYWFGESRVGSSFSTSAFFEPNGCPNACEHRRSKCPYSASNQSFSECKSVLISSCIVGTLLLLMEEILHRLIWQMTGFHTCQMVQDFFHQQ